MLRSGDFECPLVQMCATYYLVFISIVTHTALLLCVLLGCEVVSYYKL